MSSAESIALLCASTTRYGEAVSGVSVGGLSGVEWAALLSGLQSHAVNFALAKHCQDQQALCLLVDHVFKVYVASLAITEQWRVDQGCVAPYRLSKLAAVEMTADARCDRCHGVGLLAAKVCKSCDGSGYARLSGRRLADAVGVSPMQWVRVWCGRYESVIKYLQGIDSTVNNHVYRMSC